MRKHQDNLRQHGFTGGPPLWHNEERKAAIMPARLPSRILVIVSANVMYGREIVRGILDHSQRRQLWEVYYESTSAHPRIIRQVCSMLRERWFEGAIGQLHSGALVAALRRARIPVVDVSGALATGLPTVRPDFRAVGRLAARHLLERGLRNFGFYGPSERNIASELYEGFHRELVESGHDCQMFVSGPTSTGDTVALTKWLKHLPIPAGIFSARQDPSKEITWACRRQGLRVPEDLAVVGYGNDNIQCVLTTPPISSVALPGREIGFQASALLECMIRGGKPPRMPVVIPPSGVAPRQSTDVIFATDSDVAATAQYIRAHLSEPIAVSDIVRHVAVSRRALERRFMKAFGRTLGDEILRVKIECAASLLLQTDLKVPQVGQKVGLPVYRTFSRKFRQVMRLTPGAFRLRHSHGLPPPTSGL